MTGDIMLEERDGIACITLHYAAEPFGKWAGLALALAVSIVAPVLVTWLDPRWRNAALAAVALAIVLRPQPPRTRRRAAS